MFLVQKNSLHRFPFFPSSPPKSPPASLARPFEDALAARLLSLLPLPDSSPSLALSWLARAVRLLALALSDAAALIPDATSSSSSDRDAVAAYLDSGVALLDACNAASAEVDRLLRRRLHLRFALHLLSSSDEGRNPEKMRRARDSLAEWRSSSPRPTGDLARSLAPAHPPRGKLSAVRRAIYAVEAVSFLLSGALASALGGGDVAALVPADLPWANEYRKVAAAVSHKLARDCRPAELEAVESAVKKMTDVMDGIQSNGDGGNSESLRKAVEATEKATGELTEALDALSGAVNEVFRSALALRNTALHGFRAGPAGCK
ncbi:hypothetical protein BHE74_00019647 [Ensete ventricosum]|uniref:Uncharacterized protein n=1 Tax=Ensete ventricosum TaxID=4639 RepID=A0A445MJU4_ENSVE|nr:hypothetical protein BHE74_00019647 [Ensete ventricosum]RZR74381.1 hypothetical protein BHM03_00035982 [Ensete ventricosum]